MNKSVVIVGASGHGKVVADIVLKNKDNIVGFLDDNTELAESFAGFPVLGTTDQYQKYSDACFVIAIGNAAVREKLVDKLKNVSWYTAIHPTAVISELDVNIGEGTVVMANAVINAGARIGKQCIINTGAVWFLWDHKSNCPISGKRRIITIIVATVLVFFYQNALEFLSSHVTFLSTYEGYAEISTRGQNRDLYVHIIEWVIIYFLQKHMEEDKAVVMMINMLTISVLIGFMYLKT